ncbi:MAG: glycoside hydrolase family 9 protein [Fibrobacteria bacterium]
MSTSRKSRRLSSFLSFSLFIFHFDFYLLLTLSALLLPRTLPAQAFTPAEYRKALWMATRFYGGQRSGDGPNWLIMEHKAGKDFTRDADGEYSLAGGWHDCGDHVKYGQTQFYSAYMLLKAYSEFPAGFDDNYGPDYAGYRKSGDFTWEGAKGEPNGIPDLLDEAKYATDYFIRCARSETEFYNQVGEGNLDHKNWVTSVHMSTLPSSDGGQARKAFKNPNDASMPSFCGASLSLMARLYRKFDPAYAAICLTHARYAFAYAKAHPGTEGTKDGGFYPANAKWQDDFVTLAVELHRATGDASYLEEAKRLASSVSDHNYTLCYNNNDDLAAYNLGVNGQADKTALLQKITDRYKASVNSSGVGTTGDTWGRLRFPMNQAFAVALSAKLKGAAGVDAFAYKNLDYVLGSNSAGQSFLVGFGTKSPQKPHHRNIYLNDENPGNKNTLVIPERNRQAGILMGGTLNPGEYKDDVGSYEFTEGCIDYNAGLVATLGYVLSMTAPVDTSRFKGGSVGIWEREEKAKKHKPAGRGNTTRQLDVDGLGRWIGFGEYGPVQRNVFAPVFGGVNP